MDVLVVGKYGDELFHVNIPAKYIGWGNSLKTFVIPGFPHTRMHYADFRSLFDEVTNLFED